MCIGFPVKGKKKPKPKQKPKNKEIKIPNAKKTHPPKKTFIERCLLFGEGEFCQGFLSLLQFILWSQMVLKNLQSGFSFLAYGLLTLWEELCQQGTCKWSHPCAH